MFYIAIILFLIIYLFIAKNRIDVALQMILAMLPVYLVRFNFGIPLTLLEVMIWICFGFWFMTRTQFRNFIRGKYGVADFLQNRKKRQKYPFAREITFFLFISWIALLVAGFDNAALGIWKAYFFEPILVFIMVLNIFSVREEKVNLENGSKEEVVRFDYDKIVWPLIVSMFFISIYAVFQKFTGIGIVNEFWQNEATRRVTSFFPYPNAVGLYLAPLIMVVIGWAVDKFPISNFQFQKNGLWQKIIIFSFVLGTIGLSILSIYFAKSEGALIALVAGFFIFLFFYNRQAKILSVLLCIIALIFIVNNESLKVKVADKLSLKDLSGEIRKQQWRETWQMLKDGRMFQGTGLANYQEKILPYHQEGIFFNFDNDPDFYRKIRIFDDKYRAERWQPVEIYMYPHNIVLNFWTELGILGILIFVWIIEKYFMIGFRNYPNWAERKIAVEGEYEHSFLVLGLICAMFVIIIHGLVDVPYFKNDLSVMFWLLVAMISMLNLSFLENKKKHHSL